jgi:hypothetical protein
VWSDQQTNFAGTISAHGGTQGGNGGFAEVSSHELLNFTGNVNLLAPQGVTGTLLLDPANVTISTGATSGFDAFGSDAAGTYTPTSGSATSNLLNTDLQNQLATSSVIITTTNNGTSGGSTGTIAVNAAVTWSSATSLTLSANDAITVNASITQAGAGAGGNITLNAGPGNGGITIASGVTVSTASSGATITLQGDTLSFTDSTARVQATGTGGTVQIQPATSTYGVDIGGSLPASYLDLGSRTAPPIAAMP